MTTAEEQATFEDYVRRGIERKLGEPARCAGRVRAKESRIVPRKRQTVCIRMRDVVRRAAQQAEGERVSTWHYVRAKRIVVEMGGKVDDTAPARQAQAVFPVRIGDEKK